MKKSHVREVAVLIVREIQGMSAEQFMGMLTFRDYHGFRKATLSENFLRPLLNALDLRPAAFQAEIVEVTRDLRHEVHEHHYAHAYVVCLGANEHVPPPLKAMAYFGGSWRTINIGAEIDVPPRTPHGFTVSEGGHLIFLSIQSPPIEMPGKSDDYFPVDPET